jgi:hypothetical protein
VALSKMLIKIYEEHFDEFTEDTFNNFGKRIAYTVPIILKIEDKEYDEIVNNRKGKRYNEPLIMNIIQKYNEKLYKNLNNYIKDQISEPASDPKKIKDSYQKNIVYLRDYVNRNAVCSIAIKKKNTFCNAYQIWLDYKNKDIIVSLYNGKKLENN